MGKGDGFFFVFHIFVVFIQLNILRWICTENQDDTKLYVLFYPHYCVFSFYSPPLFLGEGGKKRKGLQS